MQNNQAQHQGSATIEITLPQMNEMLNAANLPILSRDRVGELFQQANRDHIVRAVREAAANDKARSYLVNLFNQAGIPMNNEQSFSGEAPQPQQAPQYQQAQSSPVHAPQAQQSYQQAKDGATGQQPQQNQQRQAYQSSSAQQKAPSAGGQPATEDRMSVHVYGGKAALCFEADMTKAEVPTVALDAALSSGVRQYDWGNKIRLQMTRGELPVVAAVLIGALQKCEFKNHGADNSKGFSMERQQGGKVFIKVFAKDAPLRTVPVMAPDVFYVASLVLRQLQKTNPWLDTTSMMSLIRATQSQQ